MKKPDAILDKICELHKLLQKIAVWRFQGKRIIFTNGCFDVLHKGHVYLLDKASVLDPHGVLIVGLNSDDSVRRLKGSGRPLNTAEDRAIMLANLYTVDAVIIFDEDTPQRLIEMTEPDILVKGGDYRHDEVAGAEFILARGGRIEIIPLLENYSTTGFIERIRS